MLVHIPTRKGERTWTNTNWPRNSANGTMPAAWSKSSTSMRSLTMTSSRATAPVRGVARSSSRLTILICLANGPGQPSSSSRLSPHTRIEEWAQTAIPAHRKKGHTRSMAHTPYTPKRVIAKAFLVRFFADGGFRVEGPFPPMQVQRLLATNECQAWLRDPALVAIWGREPVATVSELLTLSP